MSSDTVSSGGDRDCAGPHADGAGVAGVRRREKKTTMEDGNAKGRSSKACQPLREVCI